jgi:hypothetical protein
MKRLLIVGSLAFAALGVLGGIAPTSGDEGGGILAHDVYFSLNDDSPEARQALVEACRKYLSGHEGTRFFAAGSRAVELKRDVNDTDFDVSLHVYFESEAAHEAYQKDARHLEFIGKMQGNWKSVRVFDSWVTAQP